MREKINCDLCNKQGLDTYVDGSTKMGPWGNMCLNCHKAYGNGLGIGKGQKYEWKDGSYVQVEGGSQKGKKF